VYTDRSAFRVTSKAGHGVLIHYHNVLASSQVSNYTAEIVGIETATALHKNFI